MRHMIFPEERYEFRLVQALRRRVSRRRWARARGRNPLWRHRRHPLADAASICSLLRFERLIKIRQQIFGRFNPHRDAHQTIRNAQFLPVYR